MEYSSLLHRKVSMEGEINMSKKKMDYTNVAGEVKASCTVLLKETTSLAIRLPIKRIMPICLQ